MSEAIKCIPGVEPQVVLARQQYANGVSQNMFSTFAKTKDRKQMIAPVLLRGVTIPKLWAAVFSNKSDFLYRFHERQKSTDIEIGKWEYMDSMGSGYRVLSLTAVIDISKIGGSAQLNEVHRFAYTMPANSGVVLLFHISSQTPNVPAGQSFRTEAIFEITADSADSDCTISVWGNCKKMNLAFAAIQSMVVPRAIREMTSAYRKMIEMISEDLIGDSMKVLTSDDETMDLGAAAGKALYVENHGEGGANTHATVLHGMLLLLAVTIAILLLWFMTTLRGTSQMTSMFAEQFFERTRRQDAGRSFPSDTFRMGRSTNLGDAEAVLTQDQYLRQAARDTHIQSLRYRWMEQQVAIVDLESMVGRLWWLCISLMSLVLVLIVKVFFC